MAAILEQSLRISLPKGRRSKRPRVWLSVGRRRRSVKVEDDHDGSRCRRRVSLVLPDATKTRRRLLRAASGYDDDDAAASDDDGGWMDGCYFSGRLASRLLLGLSLDSAAAARTRRCLTPVSPPLANRTLLLLFLTIQQTAASLSGASGHLFPPLTSPSRHAALVNTTTRPGTRPRFLAPSPTCHPLLSPPTNII